MRHGMCGGGEDQGEVERLRMIDQEMENAKEKLVELALRRMADPNFPMESIPPEMRVYAFMMRASQVDGVTEEELNETGL